MSEEKQEVYWFSLGYDHVHKVDGVTLDRDVLVEIAGTYEEARAKMVEACGIKWSFQYEKGGVDLSYFPRGVHVL